MKPVRVIGAGLAGSEAAWQISRLGVPVILSEMKPKRFSPAHRYSGFAELVCSNSLRSAQLSNAVGLLKEEMRRLGSLVVTAADETKVPAGAALAVDRVAFSDLITRKIRENPLITVTEEEVTSIPDDGLTVIATGPLTDGEMAASISALFGGDQLSFFDAVAPIVDAESIDTSIAYFCSRYGKGDPTDYLNCPMTQKEYDAFYQALISAETADLHDFDREAQSEPNVFEGCMPVEVMAKRGYDTLRYGPMKPIGLPDPKTGKEPFAVVQLRRENVAGTMYNLVGFQTHLTYGEQKRVFGLIPGLADASYLRFGVMHRNTYINSPSRLSPQYETLTRSGLFFAGQMTGVEGYVESASSGFVAGVSAALRALGRDPVDFPAETVIGSLGHYVSSGTIGKFQPMNASFGLIAPLEKKVKGGKRARNDEYANRSRLTVGEHNAPNVGQT
ncbi:MAG: methylenetetrahydrofolate--tRNA-(uracil(54)-C(5))-methyltransferase (FADH(2)-oxidizing) TrmFO, partial [Clostridia bacterium]|nr:methylenetetrahydrofolate--tRNA-(uracil(54)-C(5))-methyltransferase (FADH(2)-oxidizing) TrmFO [Clostridia bacterium]